MENAAKPFAFNGTKGENANPTAIREKNMAATVRRGDILKERVIKASNMGQAGGAPTGPFKAAKAPSMAQHQAKMAAHEARRAAANEAKAAKAKSMSTSPAKGANSPTAPKGSFRFTVKAEDAPTMEEHAEKMAAAEARRVICNEEKAFKAQQMAARSAPVTGTTKGAASEATIASHHADMARARNNANAERILTEPDIRGIKPPPPPPFSVACLLIL